ncbi:MAG: glycoside hydrolase family 1 protein, partial [Candidatus Marinimicrobia bacterium]|nr:glycoside hydrolase family 1 protein [Candidatus Neomarinimicrobiota bacterium]
MKSLKITFVLLALLLMQVVAFSQERGKITRERGEYIETIDKTYKVKKGGTLYLSSDEGPIDVDTWSEDKVRIVVIKRADVRNESRAEEIFKEIEVTINKSGKDVTVKARTPWRRWRRRRGRSDLSFEITVPYKYNVDVETDGGSITIADLEGNLSADTQGGSITVGKIKNGDVSGKSINQYELFDGDFAMCEKWGHNTHRFSIEWSRLFPEEGVVNQKEVDHYKKVFESLLAHNLIPFPTLFHFCVPLWFRKLGGFEKKENLDHWKRYVELVAKEFLPFAKKWFTINEPGANTFGSYLTGDSPPNKINPPLAYIVYDNIMRAHGSAYHILKNAGAEEVDIVKSVVPTYPANPDDERDVKQANFSWNFY